jgi:hypothetical protein
MEGDSLLGRKRKGKVKVGDGGATFWSRNSNGGSLGEGLVEVDGVGFGIGCCGGLGKLHHRRVDCGLF